MKLPERKIIRLQEYDYSLSGAYFITICTQNRMKILSEIVGDGALDVPNIKLSQYGIVAEKYINSTDKIPNVFVDRYVIMPNHIHIIIMICEKELSDINNGTSRAPLNGTSRAPSPTNALIPHVISTFKRFVNKEIGHNIFQRSYYDRVIRDYNEYIEICRYIDENPLKWEFDELF